MMPTAGTPCEGARVISLAANTAFSQRSSRLPSPKKDPGGPRRGSRSWCLVRTLGALPSLLCRRRDPRPFIHLHPRHEFIAPVSGAEERGLAFPDIEPILAERIDDIRLVRDQDRVRAWLRRGAQHLAERLGTPVI